MLALLLSAMVSDDGRDPLATTVYGRTVRQPDEFARLPPIDLSRLRVALTPDFGFAPTERQIAATFAEKTGLFRHVFAEAEDATPDCAGADEAFEVLRAVGFLAAHLERVRTRPQDVGPNVRANVEEGLRYTAEDVARAEVRADRAVPALAGFLRTVRRDPVARHHHQPAAVARAVSGDDRRQADAHLLPLAGDWPMPCRWSGIPRCRCRWGWIANGMPFGLQIVGPRGGDAAVLAVAAALETLLAGDARTARPVPDIGRLAAARPISESPGFLGFG